jgi:hypothetical protein
MFYVNVFSLLVALLSMGCSQVGNTTVRELWGLEPMVWKRAYDFSFNLFVFFIPLLVIIISYCLIHLQMIKWVSY